MAIFQYKGLDVYYEVHGEGRPLVLLNGIMMSTKSWALFVESFSRDNRLILVDFIDQGQSGAMEEAYTQELQVAMLVALFDHLGLDRVNLVGISYGGEVALRLVVTHTHRVERLVLFNTAARTTAWLKDIGDAWNLSAADPLHYYLTTIPVIYSPRFYTKHHNWMKKRQELLVGTVFSDPNFIERMIRLTKSAEDHDVTPSLAAIEVPTLVVSSEEDMITPVSEQVLIARLMPAAEHVVLPGTGHASMYERPGLFATLVLGYVNASDVTLSVL
jgi:pimeloyl-ACP methyl ester carboxylesterase